MLSQNQISSQNYPQFGMTSTPTNVLVWEDDPGARELLNKLLEPECYHVFSAGSVPDGLELARRIEPDVIVLVLDLPDGDGLGTCSSFRSSCDAPILVLSSNGKPNFAEQILDAGADDYLVKPINNNLIIASLNKLARRACAEREASKPHDEPTL